MEDRGLVPLRAGQVLIGVLDFSRRPTPGTETSLAPSAAGQRGRHVGGCKHFANAPFSVWVAASQLPSTPHPLFLLYAAWLQLVNRDTVSWTCARTALSHTPPLRRMRCHFVSGCEKRGHCIKHFGSRHNPKAMTGPSRISQASPPPETPTMLHIFASQYIFTLHGRELDSVCIA
jgi:hypothetical protein